MSQLSTYLKDHLTRVNESMIFVSHVPAWHWVTTVYFWDSNTQWAAERESFKLSKTNSTSWNSYETLKSWALKQGYFQALIQQLSYRTPCLSSTASPGKNFKKWQILTRHGGDPDVNGNSWQIGVNQKKIVECYWNLDLTNRKFMELSGNRI